MALKQQDTKQKFETGKSAKYSKKQPKSQKNPTRRSIRHASPSSSAVIKKQKSRPSPTLNNVRSRSTSPTKQDKGAASPSSCRSSSTMTSSARQSPSLSSTSRGSYDSLQSPSSTVSDANALTQSPRPDFDLTLDQVKEVAFQNVIILSPNIQSVVAEIMILRKSGMSFERATSHSIRNHTQKVSEQLGPGWEVKSAFPVNIT